MNNDLLSESLRTTIFDLQSQLEVAQRRMQHVFAQGSSVVAQLSDRERALEARLAQHRLKREEITQSLPDKVRLNVGGRIFETTARVLRRYPGSVFDVLLSGDYPLEKDESGAIFLDRDPDVFEHVLRFLRTGIVPAIFLSEFDAERGAAAGLLSPVSTSASTLLGAAGIVGDISALSRLEVLPPAEGDLEHLAAAGILAGASSGSSNINSNTNSSSHHHAGGATAAAEKNLVTAMSSSSPSSASSVATTATATTSKPLSSWLEFSLQQRHLLLQNEARYFMIDELLLKLSKHRMRWFAAAQRGAPSPRCFATMQIVGACGYVFGGCSAADHFFDDMYRVCLHPDISAAAAAAVSRRSDGTVLPSSTTASSVGAFATMNYTNNHSNNGHDASIPLGEISSYNDGGTDLANSGNIVHHHGGAASGTPDTGAAATASGGSHLLPGGGAAGADDPLLSVYAGPFEWMRVQLRRGAVPEPRSGHSMSIVPTVSTFMMMMLQEEEQERDAKRGSAKVFPASAMAGASGGAQYSALHDDCGSAASGGRMSTSSASSSSASSSAVSHHGLLLLFGNDRTRMLPNAAVFDTDEQTWTVVNQLGSPVPGRSGHSLTNIGEFFGDEDPALLHASSSSSSSSSWRHANSSTMGSPQISTSAAAAAAAAGGHHYGSANSSSHGLMLSSAKIPKVRFILIGGKRIFPDTVHYSDVFIGVYDASNHSLTWRPLPLAGDPEPRSYHSSVFQPANGLVYVFGGIINNIYSSDLATLNPLTGVWRTITPTALPGYVVPVARSGHVAFLVDDGTKMLVAGSYAEDSEDLTVATLTFATMRWSVAKVDPRGQTPSRRAAISGGVLPAMTGGARLPLLVVFAGFELSARRCFNDLFVLPL